MLVITGMHRSGTTFLGSLLHQTRRYAYLHEPFNKTYGIDGVKDWYPYVRLRCPTGNYARLLTFLHEGDIYYKVPAVKDRNPLKYFARKVVKSRGNIDLIKYRTVLRERQLLVKDPFLSLSAGNLVTRYHDVKVVYVVRHPAAVYESLMRMGWGFDLQALMQQVPLMEDYSNLLEFDCIPQMGLPEVVARLWKILYAIINDQSREIGRNVHIIRHEDLCIKTLEEVERLFEFLGMKIDNLVYNFIKKYMYADKIRAEGLSLHDFSRNSRRMAYSWKRKVKPEYEEIISIAGDVLSLYGYQ
ncbi:MAG: sulfotransferase [Candidatus Electrothrix sp. GW3-4]|uniref:sulfotransferase n=1 Tax=Candidatus Electrothrix sp. GW3-4 TaxID=3126740 RepID=UPI0030CDCDCA